TRMSSQNSDRNLLIGVLALQLDFINREQLIAAVSAWALDKSQALDAILLRQGALAESRRALLESILREHLNAHGEAPARSLAGVGPAVAIQEVLNCVSDADVEQSLAALGSRKPLPDDPDATASVATGAPTSAGQRFRILRPHARGGLGELFL